MTGRLREGGSTISQQLAKTSFTGGERTMGRKAQEALITLWLEARLSKEDILSRYISNVYFGNNIHGLRAAARFYFNAVPERLTLSQAAMLAGLVNAPNRLAPNRNLAGAQARARLVLRAMTDLEFISEARYANVQPARLSLAPGDDLRPAPISLTGSCRASSRPKGTMASARSRPRSRQHPARSPSGPFAVRHRHPPGRLGGNAHGRPDRRRCRRHAIMRAARSTARR